MDKSFVSFHRQRLKPPAPYSGGKEAKAPSNPPGNVSGYNQPPQNKI